MKFNQTAVFNNLESQICPHFALKGDDKTYAAFPSSINACYCGNFPVTPKFSHQRSYCLSSNYLDCPFYKNEDIKKIPKELRYKSQRFIGKRKWILILGIFGVLTILVIFQMGFGEGWVNHFANYNIMQTQRLNLSPTEVDNNILSTGTLQIGGVDETEIASLSTEVPPTISPVLEPTGKTDPLLALDTPIGGEKKFVIHQVVEGESLQYLADRHNTSPEAILAINESIISPLWVGWVIVIPMNTNDVDGLPSFSAYQIAEEGITLERLAGNLVVPTEELSLYNNIEAEHILHLGEWLLIPRN